jgi:glycosyltransferase involved in cell wall biosynthesis
MSVRLAVLITYHNERELLRECLTSLQAQTEAPDEVIVYDDASAYPAAAYIPSAMQVSIIRGEANRGPSCGRNILLRAAESDFVHFHDADDLFDARWCAKVRNAIRTSDPDTVFTEVSSYQGDRLMSLNTLGLARLHGRDLVSFSIAGALLTSSGTYRRSAVLAVGGYRDALWQSEDWDFHVRLAASGITYGIIDEPLVIKRVRVESRSENHQEVFTSAVQGIALLAEELSARYRPELSDAAARAGMALYRIGAHADARKAFLVARNLGGPHLRSEHSLYRLVASLIGLEGAEWTGSVYRRLVPASVRGRMRPAIS